MRLSRFIAIHRPLCILSACSLLLVSNAVAQPPELNRKVESALPPQELIAKNIRAYAEAINGNNPYFDAAYYVSGARIGFYGGPEWGRQWVSERRDSQLKIEKIDIMALKGDDAMAHVSYRWRTPMFRSELLEETLTLHHIAAPQVPGREWQIVPPVVPPVVTNAPPVLMPEDAPLLFLNETATAISDPKPSVVGSRENRALPKLKKLGLAVLQFVQDYDETYAFTPEYAEEALAPYLKDQTVWQVPEGGSKFTFNSNLSGKSLAQVEEVARTVMFYEGNDAKPVFRYDGKAAIGFTDGHVALLSPDDIKNVIWKL